ncbi:MAG TPA: sugar ABC transporter permease [Candidatus Faecivivens stercorigallinarum]|nr:sugar ABC transporter permease [Candidatus Faecivivens stercorigallinarum]
MEKIASGARIHPAAQTQLQKKSLFSKILTAMRPYLMVAPAMAVFGVFILYPIFYMIYLSFFDWNLIGEMKYIGLENYTDMLSDKDFWQVLGNSVYYMVMVVIFQMILSLLLAAYLNRNTRVNRILQSIAFTPYITSMVSVAFIWMWLMDSDYGLLNYLLSLIGLGPVGWLSDPKVAMNSLVLVSVWKGLGYNTIIIISAMQSVPGYLYEAAALDKTPRWKAFWKITLPMISPTLFFLALMNIIAALKVFETVNIMTQGGPMNSTNTLVYNIYQYGFDYFKIGYASALGVALMVVIGFFTLIYFRVLSKRVYYN